MEKEEKEREEMYLDLIRANQMLLSGRPTKTMDSVYIHGLSEGMIKSGDIFSVACGLYADRIEVITFNGSNGEGAGQVKTPGEAWPGKDWYIKKLSQYIVINDGLQRKDLELIPTRPAFHTRDETDALVELAQEKEWKKVGILTVAYHYPRSFICLIQSMKAIGYWFEAYPTPPESTDWWLPMKGSQGRENTYSFAETMKESIKVIDTYVAKGFGCTFPELFYYIQNRKEIVQNQEFDFNEREFCVVCDSDTGYKKNTPVDLRNYIDGGGSVCKAHS